MSDEKHLTELNRRGLIHAPDESQESYFRRCQAAIRVAQVPPLVKTLFDIDPDWVPVVYDNKGLYFWEGGCTWITQDQVTVQLNRAFQKRGSWFGYSRDEILAHELVHAVREKFEEPIFEEVLAYQTTSFPLRRYFGPIFRTANESFFFMIALSLFTATFFLSQFHTLALVGFLCFLSIGALRLLRMQLIFSRTQKKLSRLVGKQRALAVMLRLTDKEIIRFSKMSAAAITAYANEMSTTSLRWQQITLAYFAVRTQFRARERTARNGIVQEVQ
jgi:hypothetical protein